MLDNQKLALLIIIMTEHEITEQEALEILKKYAPSKQAYEKVLAHSLRVRDKVVEIGSQIKNVDMEFLKTAALLHDIGRFFFPPGAKDSIRHGIEGGKILRDIGLNRHARVCETHIGVGITKKDIISQSLPLPLNDYVPESVEEILIAYADNLDSPGIEDEKDVEERFAREVGEGYRQRVVDFHKKVHNILNSKQG